MIEKNRGTPLAVERTLDSLSSYLPQSDRCCLQRLQLTLFDLDVSGIYTRSV